MKRLSARGYQSRGIIPERQHFPRVEVAQFGWLSERAKGGLSRAAFDSMCEDGATGTFIMHCGTRAVRVHATPEDYQ